MSPLKKVKRKVGYEDSPVEGSDQDGLVSQMKMKRLCLIDCEELSTVETKNGKDIRMVDT